MPYPPSDPTLVTRSHPGRHGVPVARVARTLSALLALNLGCQHSASDAGGVPRPSASVATLASALTAQHDVLACRTERDAPFDAVGVEGYDIHRRAPIPATTSKLFQPKEEEEESDDSDDFSSLLTECEGGWIDPATYGDVFVRMTDT